MMRTGPPAPRASSGGSPPRNRENVSFVTLLYIQSMIFGEDATLSVPALTKRGSTGGA